MLLVDFSTYTLVFLLSGKEDLLLLFSHFETKVQLINVVWTKTTLGTSMAVKAQLMIILSAVLLHDYKSYSS